MNSDTGPDSESSLTEEKTETLGPKAKFGRYTILEPLGAGGMAQVYKATTATGRVFTLKRIHRNYSQNQDFIRMFLEEAKISIGLKHPNIVRVLDFGQLEGSYYLALEYVFGKDLGSLLRNNFEQKTWLPPDVICLIVQQCAEALAYAHSQVDSFGRNIGIIHRDVSPPNILVSYNGESKLLDFGIAKAIRSSGRQETRSGVLKGKFSYMSPEQAYGKPLTPQSDLFSLGIVFHELLTCRSLFHTDDEIETLERVRKAKVSPPSALRKDIPAELDAIVMKALEPKLKNRYSSGQEMSEAIQRYLRKNYPRSDKRQVARYLRGAFTLDFRERKQRLHPEEWQDVLIEGIGDEDLLLDRHVDPEQSHARFRAPKERLDWKARLIYDPRVFDRIRAFLIFVGAIALLAVAGILIARSDWPKRLTETASTPSPSPELPPRPAPGGFSALLLKADEAERAGKISEALSSIERALAINPFETGAQVKKHFLLLRLGQIQEACSFFQKTESSEADRLLAEAACQEVDGNVQRSYDLYRSFIQKFPTEDRAELVKRVMLSVQERSR